VVALFRDSYNIPLVHVEAEQFPLRARPASPTPSRSARPLGRLFIDVFEQEAKKIGGAEFLAQARSIPT
jgi:GMP synthase (glutamine-hydrolysing)